MSKLHKFLVAKLSFFQLVKFITQKTRLFKKLQLSKISWRHCKLLQIDYRQTKVFVCELLDFCYNHRQMLTKTTAPPTNDCRYRCSLIKINDFLKWLFTVQIFAWFFTSCELTAQLILAQLSSPLTEVDSARGLLTSAHL